MALFLLAETGEHIPLCKPPVSALIKRDGGTRKRFPHHTAPPCGGAGQGVLAGLYLAVLGEHGLFHAYHRMGIDSAIRLW